MNSQINQSYKTEFRRKLLTEGSGSEIMSNLYNDLEANLKMTRSGLEANIEASDFETVEEHYALLEEINRRIIAFHESARKSKSKSKVGRSLTQEDKQHINKYIQTLSPGEFDTREVIQDLAKQGLETTLIFVGNYLRLKEQKEILRIKKLDQQYKWERY